MRTGCETASRFSLMLQASHLVSWHDQPMRFLVKTAVIAVSIWLTTLIVSGVQVETSHDSGWETVLTFLVIGLIFTLVNAIHKPIVNDLTFPLFILTFGLFTFVVIALMLLLTSWTSSPSDLVLLVEGSVCSFGG